MNNFKGHEIVFTNPHACKINPHTCQNIIAGFPLLFFLYTFKYFALFCINATTLIC